MTVPTDQPIEDLVRETLLLRAHDVPDRPVTLRAPAPRRRARVWTSVGLAAAAAATVVVMVAVTRDRPVSVPVGGSTTPATTSATTSAAPAPTATRTVSYGRLSLTVPSAWPVGPFFCANPPAHAVVVDVGSYPSCAVPYPTPTPPPDPTAVVVRVGPDQVGRLGTLPSPTPVTVDGTQVFRSMTDPLTGAGGTWALLVPGVAEVDITAPSEAAAAAVLDTARLADVDPFGCPARMPAPTAQPVTTGVLGGQPVSAVVCSYFPDGVGAELIGSGTVSPGALSLFTAAVAAGTPQAAPPMGQPAADALVILRDAAGQAHVVTVATGNQTTVTDGHTVVVLGPDGYPSVPTPWTDR